MPMLGRKSGGKTRKMSFMGSFMGRPKPKQEPDDGRVSVRAYNKKVRALPTSAIYGAAPFPPFLLPPCCRCA